MKSPVLLCVVIFSLFVSCDMVVDEPDGGERSWRETEKIASNGYLINAVTIEMAADNNGNLFVHI